MALITKPLDPPQKDQFRIRLAKNIYEHINAYCQWQGLSLDYFLEQAALEVFKKDKDWKEHRGNLNLPTIEVD